MTTTKDKSEIVKLIQLPSGMDEKEYKSYQKWTNRRWAWEFLRRNKRFQAWCNSDEISTLTKKKINEIAREEFGLIEYKHFMERFSDVGVKKPRFTTSNIQSWSFITDEEINKSNKNIKFIRQPGTVLIRFNVRAISKSAKALNKQLEVAKSRLNKRKEKWLKLSADTVDKGRVKITDGIGYLRLLDIVNYNDTLEKKNKMTKDKLYEKAFPNLAWREKSDPADKVEFERAFESRIETALNYAESYYLELAASKVEMKSKRTVSSNAIKKV